MPTTKFQKELYKHAKVECSLASALPTKHKTKVKRLIKELSSMCPSSAEASQILNTFYKLAIFDTLTPIPKPTKKDFTTATYGDTTLYIHNRYPYLMSYDQQSWFILAGVKRIPVSFPLVPAEVNINA